VFHMIDHVLPAELQLLRLLLGLDSEATIGFRIKLRYMISIIKKLIFKIRFNLYILKIRLNNKTYYIYTFKIKLSDKI